MDNCTRVGFLTLDLQEFAADCISRICRHASGFRIKAYPIRSRTSQYVDFEYRQSTFEGKSKTFDGKGDSPPEGLQISINWSAAWACAKENDIVVLFGIHAGTALVLTLLARLLHRKIVSVNQTMPPETERKRRWWVRMLKGWILRRCDVHVVQTPVTGDTLREVYGLSEDRFVLAPFEAGWRVIEALRGNSSPIPRGFRQEFGWREDDCVFLFVGSLLRFKGPLLILRAIQRLKARGVPARAVFCGQEVDRANEWSVEQYQSQAKELGVEDDVRFVGAVPYADLVHSYRESDVCVLPTARDMWPKVLVEAASFSKPLITTTSCGASGSLVRDGETGRVVPPNDVDSLANAMEDMLDPVRRREMGRRARAFCIDFCDAEKEAAGYCKALELARCA